MSVEELIVVLEQDNFHITDDDCQRIAQLLRQRCWLREDTPEGATYRHFQLVAPNGVVIRGMNRRTAEEFGFDVNGGPE